MANPKRRASHRRKNTRRSHHALPANAVGECPNCGALRRPHRVCGTCGFYNGRAAIPVDEE
jgi:large subunit ribosomal protein L32